MALRYDDITELPPLLRAQAERQLLRDKARKARKQPAVQADRGQFDSRGEYEFYLAQILPKIQSGLIAKWEGHKRFLLLPAAEYCGLALPAAHYTPDFFITYTSGHKEAVEIKSKVIRKLQRDYIYRRRLFIEIHAKPNGWGFREIITGSEEK